MKNLNPFRKQLNLTPANCKCKRYLIMYNLTWHKGEKFKELQTFI